MECVYGSLDEEVSKFIANVYYSRDDYNFNCSLEELENKIIQEDKMYIGESHVYTVYNKQNEILGTVRKIRKTNKIVLPIEREFDVDLKKYDDEFDKVFEVSRFGTKTANPRVFQILIKEGINQFDNNDLLVASLDSRVLMGLRKLRFPWKTIAKPKEYMGSKTVPVILKKQIIDNRFIEDKEEKLQKTS